MESAELERQMALHNSVQMARARHLLNPKPRRDPAWPALAAAAFFACCAMTFAITSILSPNRDYAAAVDKHGR